MQWGKTEQIIGKSIAKHKKQYENNVNLCDCLLFVYKLFLIKLNDFPITIFLTVFPNIIYEPFSPINTSLNLSNGVAGLWYGKLSVMYVLHIPVFLA